ncbi:hypothetical protein MYX07_03030 [Patescibacteria group bacterium AH-259-L07]|nr:hypothetical protein [Patescibacteria group bacterium AH-259-L07]
MLESKMFLREYFEKIWNLGIEPSIKTVSDGGTAYFYENTRIIEAGKDYIEFFVWKDLPSHIDPRTTDVGVLTILLRDIGHIELSEDDAAGLMREGEKLDIKMKAQKSLKDRLLWHGTLGIKIDVLVKSSGSFYSRALVLEVAGDYFQIIWKPEEDEEYRIINIPYRNLKILKLVDNSKYWPKGSNKFR